MNSNILKTSKSLTYTVGSKKLRSLVNYRGNKIALIGLHGGPGYPHDYLKNLFELESIVPIILYDQIGCGKSEMTGSYENLLIKDFVEELEEIRKFYKVNRLILYGHSWGSILALEYYLKYPDNVCSILFVSPCLSVKSWINDSLFYISKLANEDQKVIEEANKTYRYNSPRYLEVVDEYYKLCVYDQRPKPEVLNYCDQNSSPEIYGRFWGVNEFTVTGILKNYDALPKLPQIKVPTIYIAGEFDECLKETLAEYSKLTSNSTFAVIKGAHHLPNFEKPAEMFPILTDFIKNSMRN